MKGIVVTLTPGTCVSDLVKARNEYRERNGRFPDCLVMSEESYNHLAAEYPIRNYGDKFNGVEVVVITPYIITIASDATCTLEVGSSADQWTGDDTATITVKASPPLQANRTKRAYNKRK